MDKFKKVSDKNENSSPSKMIPGQLILRKEDVVCNQGRKTVSLEVKNAGDRPIQVGSHYHFFEVNKKLQFDRSQSFGMRLNIPSSTAVRFEPGESKQVTLVEFGGKKVIFGHNNLVNGLLNKTNEGKAFTAAKEKGFM